MIRCILMDIEGTTTDIGFVHRVLFPYAAERLSAYIEAHGKETEVKECLQAVRDTVLQEDGHDISRDEAIDTLLEWMCDDRKHPALKTLQGFIWKTGYEQADYQGHLYPDVPEALQQWKQQGIALAIYSSGSVQAQRLLFSHSVFGDLTPCFSAYFDTAVGAKRDADSYRTIASQLAVSPDEILFLSDIEAELDAAKMAGLQTLQLIRDPQMERSERHPQVTSFQEIQSPLTIAL